MTNKCPECENEEFETADMMLVTGQVGGEEKMLVVHTCKACEHKWRGKA